MDRASLEASVLANTISSLSPSSSVKVAVNIRPLIDHEIEKGSREVLTVFPEQQQVWISPDRAFTFDCVYGGTGGPSMSTIFEDCVLPLVNGLFDGYNATVLAYGQTGSGKTFTMGTGFTKAGDLGDGVAPNVMRSLFEKSGARSHDTDFTFRVSFIEIHKEDIRDLLDPSHAQVCGNQQWSSPAHSRRLSRGSMSPAPERHHITIRELGNGVQVVGATETEVRTLEDMMQCLTYGLSFRATAGHLMNSRSSRSHAIFTIAMEQHPKGAMDDPTGKGGRRQTLGGSHLFSKMHLVDLAGSERVKRTMAEGARLREGIHINKGLLALGNVISSLGDEKKRRDGGHVPYRDSKLTRLLQDSLGGNSRTVMIACVSPAHINLDETVNTLQYANRARNIKNKPMVNTLGDLGDNELRKLRLQLAVLQAEVAKAKQDNQPEEEDEIELLRKRVNVLESSNAMYQKSLKEARETQLLVSERILEMEVINASLEAELASAEEVARARQDQEHQSSMKTISKLKRQLETIKGDYEKAIRRVKESELDIRSKLETIRDNAKSEVEAWLAKEVALKAGIAEARDEAGLLRQKLLEAHAEAAELRVQVRRVREWRESSTGTVAMADEGGSWLRSENEELRTEIALLAEEKGFVPLSVMREAEQRAAEESRKWQEAQEEIGRLRVQVLTRGQLANGWQEQDVEDGGRMEPGAVMELRDRNDRLENEVVAVAEICRQEAKKAKEMEDLFQTERQRNAEMEARARELQKEAAEFQLAAAHSSACQRQAEQRAMAAEEDAQEAMAKLREAERSVEELRENLRQLHELTELSQVQNEEVQKALEEETRKVTELGSRNLALATEVVSLQEMVRAKEQELVAVRGDLQETKVEMVARGDKVEVLGEKLAEMESESERLRLEMEMFRNQWRVESSKFVESEWSVMQLKGQVSVAEQRAEELTRRVTQLQTERDMLLEAIISGKPTRHHLSNDGVTSVASYELPSSRNSASSFFSQDEVQSRLGPVQELIFGHTSGDLGRSMASISSDSLTHRSVESTETVGPTVPEYPAIDPKEAMAARIQTFWRMWARRRAYLQQKRAAIVVQRAWRRYVGSEAFFRRRVEQQGSGVVRAAVSERKLDRTNSSTLTFDGPTRALEDEMHAPAVHAEVEAEQSTAGGSKWTKRRTIANMLRIGRGRNRGVEGAPGPPPGSVPAAPEARHQILSPSLGSVAVSVEDAAPATSHSEPSSPRSYSGRGGEEVDKVKPLRKEVVGSVGRAKVKANRKMALLLEGISVGQSVDVGQGPVIDDVRVYGSSALGLHGSRNETVAAYVRPPSPQRERETVKSALARERLAWEPYIFNKSVPSLLRKRGKEK